MIMQTKTIPIIPIGPMMTITIMREVDDNTNDNDTDDNDNNINSK